MKVLEFLFFIVIIYLLYQLFRFILAVLKSVRNAGKRLDEQDRDRMGSRTGRARSDDKTIVLDKDQYKVD